MYFIIRYHNANEYYPLIYTCPIGSFFCLIFGYLLCDTTELVANEYSLRVIILVIHHLLFGMGCLYPLMKQKYGGLIVIGLLME
uniref:TLC domain-containing protein n=1 Tax=Strongyloides papillosus TaxID=174720 RepID=A0A0N5BZC6_STREA